MEDVLLGKKRLQWTQYWDPSFVLKIAAYLKWVHIFKFENAGITQLLPVSLTVCITRDFFSIIPYDFFYNNEGEQANLSTAYYPEPVRPQVHVRVTRVRGSSSSGETCWRRRRPGRLVWRRPEPASARRSWPGVGPSQRPVLAHPSPTPVLQPKWASNNWATAAQVRWQLGQRPAFYS